MSVNAETLTSDYEVFEEGHGPYEEPIPQLRVVHNDETLQPPAEPVQELRLQQDPEALHRDWRDDSVAETESDLVRAYLNEIRRYRLLEPHEEDPLAMLIDVGRQAEALQGSDGVIRGIMLRKLAGSYIQAHKDLGRPIELETTVYHQKLIEEGLAAKHELTEHNLRLVVSFAMAYNRKWGKKGLPLLDLIQEGNKGLMTAVDKFDYRRGIKFSAWAAWRIRQAIVRGNANKAKTIRIPVNTQQDVERMRRVSNEFYKIYEREPTHKELAKAAQISPKSVPFLNYAQTMMREPVSLEEPISDDEGKIVELKDTIVQDEDHSPEALAIKGSMKKDVLKAVNTLDARQSKILGLRYGLFGEEPKMPREIGLQMGVSDQRIVQILRKTRNKLKNNVLVASWADNI